MLRVEMSTEEPRGESKRSEPPPDLASLLEPVQRVSRFLEEAGVEACVHEFSEQTPTAEAAARAVGCEVGAIVKSLIFICDTRPTLVMVSGDLRADDEKIRRALDAESVKIAKPAVVLDETGFEVGGVAPFPLPKIEAALCDRALLSRPVVWAGAGSERHMVALAPHDLLRLARAKPADVTMRAAASG